jgi:hypothetical protein
VLNMGCRPKLDFVHFCALSLGREVFCTILIRGLGLNQNARQGRSILEAGAKSS